MKKYAKFFLLLFVLVLLFIGYKDYSRAKARIVKKEEKIKQDLRNLALFDYGKIKLEHLKQLDQLDYVIVQKGIKEASKHKVVFAGITRDNFDDLFTTIRHIEYLGSFFQDYRVIFFENDSKDLTKESLKKWQSLNHRVKILSEDFKNRKRPNIDFLAKIRNKYLKEYLQEEFDQFDCFVEYFLFHFD